MNSVQLVGRFVADPEIRYSNNGSSVANFTLAVDRRFKQEGGETADFIRCVGFGKTAEFIEKYFSKGKKIGLTGHIQTGSYTNKDGVKIYTTDVIVESTEFVESKSSNDSNVQPNPKTAKPADDGFVNVPDGLDEELPFA